ncbi:uncharacterized protein B0P05DRAFT_531522 [Gilbertella persicaria]|uniref:uncharacterized protein n=1 Tax=Gilbertella persicaria TaxID=101096 RepID=UPI00221FCA06|nr:uncharacterized protein B0P05DRAFT_531522 [Gilbertella persicaria]KAI8087580.1 hypothetical protein B0P05DRAFT_531522 [Gilbertella persicaria]
MLSKSSFVSLCLLEPTLYTEQKPDTCSVIRGTVYINVPKPTKVQRIYIRFHGKMETKSHSFESDQKKSIAQEQLELFPIQSTPSKVLNAGTTPFSFEMQIPSGLPETIDCSDIKVHYQVSAVMEYISHSVLRGTTTSQDIAKQDICVARLPYQGILTGDVSNSIDSRAHQSTWLCYQLLIDKKAVALGSILPITFRLLPTTEGLIIDRVSIQMLERRHLYRDTTYTSHSVYTLSPCEKNTVSFPTEPLKDAWEGTVHYRIPAGKNMVHSTRPYSAFHVDHYLLVSIGFSVPSSTQSRFGSQRTHKMVTFRANIDVLDKTVGDLDALELPSYDNPPPFENEQVVYGEYDRKFVEPPAYHDVCST